MKPSARERMFRVLLAALMNSELSTRELREIADEMSSSPTLLFDFSGLLRETIDRLRDSETKKQTLKGNLPIADSNLAYNIIQRRKLPKSEVLSIMTMASPHTRNQMSNMGISSMRQILEKFFSLASADDLQKFMSLIQPGDSTDPYLRGILRKE